MPSILALPDELLVKIALQVNQADLITLAIITHGFHRCVTPLLYRFVYFHWTLYHKKASFASLRPFLIEKGVFEHLLQESDGFSVQPTRIFNLSSFVRTIETSTDLRQSILVASFEWEVEVDHIDEPLQAGLRLLEPSLRFLALSPPVSRCALSCVSITSLDLHMNRLAAAIYGIRIADLYEVFCIPTLRRLKIEGIDDLEKLNIEPDKNKWGWSNVTSLTLLNYWHTGWNALDEVLKWPAMLKSFYVEIVPPPRMRSRPPPLNSFTPLKLMETLEHHRDSLEELSVVFNVAGIVNIGPNSARKLRSMTHVKYLGLALENLLPKPKASDDKGTEWPVIKGGMGSMLSLLPPALEELRVEVKHPWDILESIRRDSDHSTERNWLAEIAKQKDNRYPWLKKITFWDSCYDKRSTDAPHDRRPKGAQDITALFLQQDQGNKLISRLRRKGVRLSVVVGTSTPLFGNGNEEEYPLDGTEDVEDCEKEQEVELVIAEKANYDAENDRDDDAVAIAAVSVINILHTLEQEMQ